MAVNSYRPSIRRVLLVSRRVKIGWGYEKIYVNSVSSMAKVSDIDR